MNPILSSLPPALTIPETGKIRLPPKIKRVRLDIGLSENAPMSRQWIQEDFENDLLVFGFEPNPQSRKFLFNGNSQWPNPIDPELIGKKLIVLPFALCPHPEVCRVPFYITKDNSGCSSLFKPKTIKIQEKIQVEACSLKNFLSLFPFEQVSWIEYIKVDAQGGDFGIIQGIGEYFDKIAVITLEAEVDEYPESDNRIDKIEKFLMQRNFVREHSLNCDDPTFVNQAYKSLIETKKIRPFQRG